MHAIVAPVFGIKIVDIKIGVGEPNFRLLKRLAITPFFFGGFVEVDPESLLRKPNLIIILFYMIGPIGNVLLLVLGHFIGMSFINALLFNIINKTIILVSIFPIGIDNDLKAMILALKEKKA